MNFILGLFHWHKIKIWLQLFYWSSLIKIIGSPYIHIYTYYWYFVYITWFQNYFFKTYKVIQSKQVFSVLLYFTFRSFELRTMVN